MMNSPAGISTISGQSAQSRKMRGVRVASVAGLVVASPDCLSAAAMGGVAAREHKSRAKIVIADLIIGPPCRLEIQIAFAPHLRACEASRQLGGQLIGALLGGCGQEGVQRRDDL